MVGVEAVERGAVKRGGEAQALLVRVEVFEARVGVLGEAEAGEEAHRLFARAGGLVEIHLAVGGGGVGELAGKPLAEQISGDGAGLVGVGHGEARQRRAGG